MSAVLTLPITQSDSLNALAGVFADAFVDDPGMQHICQQKRAGYEGRLRGWFYATDRLQMANQQPILTLSADGRYAAGALLTAPNAALRIGSLGRWFMDAWQGAGTISLWRTLAHLGRLGQYQPKAPHFRLEFLAVAPEHQGKGYGRALLETIHKLSEQHPQSTGIWLETANPNNIPLYEHFGYHITGRGRIGKTAEAIMMFRPNQKGRI